MNQNKRIANNNRASGKARSSKKFSKSGKKYDKSSDYNGDAAKLDAEGRDNNPNWYFLTKEVAEQVSQMSFQELAGTTVPLLLFYNSSTANLRVPSIMRIDLNPCPGVQMDITQDQKSGINLAGFRIFSKLSAFTGRVATYGPQDLSTMILFMGELISLIEYLRRAFGVAFTYNERNRAYPKSVIEAMGINADDLFTYYSDYRTRFNSLITRLNQVPIPKNVAYFEKCASLYEKLYLDTNSSMAQTIFLAPFTTWSLDETSYAGGTVLRTSEWLADQDGSNSYDTHPMSYYMVMLSYRIDELMNSSTFQTVYTDLLNLATKMKMEFWKFDYLMEGYTVWPEYNENFSLQMHNMVSAKYPNIPRGKHNASIGVTPLNDVYPDANHNALLYNPGFKYVGSTKPTAPCMAIVDSLSPLPTVEDRIELTRFMALAPGYHLYTDSDNNNYEVGYVLPDHYVVEYVTFVPGDASPSGKYTNFYSSANDVSVFTAVDWSPIFYELDANNEMKGGFVGDLNFYTDIDDHYLRKVNDFIGLALYDFRS